MTTAGNPHPSKPDPKAPHPGYDEEQPRSPREANQPPPDGVPHREDGGLDRDPASDPDPAEDA